MKFIEPVLDGGARTAEQVGQLFQRMPARGGLECEAQPFLFAPRTGDPHQPANPDLLRRGQFELCPFPSHERSLAFFFKKFNSIPTIYL